MGTETAGIRYQSEHREKVQNLMYLVNERTLMEEHQKQNRKKASAPVRCMQYSSVKHRIR